MPLKILGIFYPGCIAAEILPTIRALADYAMILVPGGDPRSIIDNPQIDRLLREADAAGALIGAVCAGPSLLVKAGIV